RMDIPDESFDVRAEEVTDIFWATPLNLGQSNNTFKCSVCSYTTDRKFNLERHEQRHKRSQWTLVLQIRKRSHCALTPNKVTLPKSDRLSHSAEIICEQCAKPFHSKFVYSSNVQILFESLHGHASLKRHEDICPLNENKLKSEFSCVECFQLFYSKDTLNYHKKGKHGPERYLCPRCGKRYSWRSSLNAHKNL
ncbi:hypothetical protein MAR_033091, partial [Mya arenaria]